jgi:hypothetical protein
MIHIKHNGGNSMKKIQGIGISNILCVLMIMTMSIVCVQVPAQAATNCLTGSELDADCDGLKDTEETQISQCGTGQVTQVACASGKKDLFVILVPLTGGLLPTNPLSLLSNAAGQNLAITVHQINANQVVTSTVRNVTSNQKALRILESNLVGSYVGYSSPGTPMTTADDAYVYTNKIYATVDTICGSKACVDADNEATTKQAVKEKYIRHTIAHESGHMMKLRGGCTTDAGCHYPSQTNSILDASVGYVSSGGGKKLYIGRSFVTTEDPQNVQLR